MVTNVSDATRAYINRINNPAVQINENKPKKKSNIALFSSLAALAVLGGAIVYGIKKRTPISDKTPLVQPQKTHVEPQKDIRPQLPPEVVKSQQTPPVMPETQPVSEIEELFNKYIADSSFLEGQDETYAKLKRCYLSAVEDGRGEIKALIEQIDALYQDSFFNSIKANEGVDIPIGSIKYMNNSFIKSIQKLLQDKFEVSTLLPEKGDKYDPKTMEAIRYEMPKYESDFGKVVKSPTQAGYMDKDGNVILKAPVSVYINSFSEKELFSKNR